MAADGTLILALLSDEITARSLVNGAELWSVERAVTQPMTAADGRLFAAAGEDVYAMSARDGTDIWRAAVGALTSPPVVAGEWVLVAAAERLIALRAADGQRMWDRALGAVTHRVAVEGDRVFVPVQDGRIVALALTTGEPQWERKLGGAPTEPAVYRERLYVGVDAKQFYCLKIRGGEVLWQRGIGGRLIGPAVVDDDHVYFVAMDHVLRALDRNNGAQRWNQALNFRPIHGPVLLGAYVALSGRTTEVVGFDVRNGRPTAKLAIPDKLSNIPAFLAPGQAGPAAIAAITARQGEQWTLTLAEPPIEVPGLPAFVPLTELPGEVIAIELPRGMANGES